MATTSGASHEERTRSADVHRSWSTTTSPGTARAPVVHHPPFRVLADEALDRVGVVVGRIGLHRPASACSYLVAMNCSRSWVQYGFAARHTAGSSMAAPGGAAQTIASVVVSS